MGSQFASKSEKPAQREGSPSLSRTGTSLAPPHPVLQLQSTIGNQAVLHSLKSQKIQRKCSCGGTCPRCQERSGSTRTSGSARLGRNIQLTGDPALPRAVAGGHRSPAHEQRIAESGFGGTPRTLPHLGTVQRSFGHHSVADVEAFVGGAASSANRALGSSAYSAGDRVAFDQAPGLQTAAHEAAHVVQQRSNFDLPGGIGRPGDRHERHADEVAEAVVQGRSAESLLNQYDVRPRAGAEQLQFQERSPRAETYQARRPGFRPRAYPQPAGAGVAAQGDCQLPTGTLQWALAPRVGYVNERVEFLPNSTVAQTNPTISYIQTVSSSVFDPSGASSVDVLPGETDPYYGAQRDEENQTWVDEPTMVQRRDPAYDDMSAPREGSRPYTAATGSAVLNDSPHLNIGEIKYFETVVVVIETGEVLGSLSWNIQRFKAGFVPGFVNTWLGWEQPTSTIVRNVVCTPGASPEFDAVVARFYAEHPEAVRPQ